jgi:2-dehydropantoate 2-reductase
MAKELDEHTRIAVYGAGNIGCFVGGLLVLAGRHVTFLARPRIAAELAVHGLLVSDLEGLEARIIPDALGVQAHADFLRETGLVLLTVKSRDTQAAAEEIVSLTAPGVPVLSLQNGVENPVILRERLGQDRVLGGMALFNVIHKGHGIFRRATSGGIVIECGRPDILRLLSVPSLLVSDTDNIEGVQWGKLLLNLNNALNALSGLPLAGQLKDRAWRRLLASQITEALCVLKAAGIKPVSPVKLPLRYLPGLLRLPNLLFRLAGRSTLQIDPEARSSTWEDLMLQRPAETSQFQGAIIKLAQEHGLKAPLSEAVFELVKQAEAAGAGPPDLSPESIIRRLPARARTA